MDQNPRDPQTNPSPLDAQDTSPVHTQGSAPQTTGTSSKKVCARPSPLHPPPFTKLSCTLNQTKRQQQQQNQTSLHEDFENYYLRQITAEFADEIEKLRDAKDFKESSVPMLVQALKQGAVGFSEEEKGIVMNWEER